MTHIVYRLKISLVQPYRPIGVLHCIIQLRADTSFFALQQALASMFKYPSDTWRFFIARQKTDELATLLHCSEQVVSHPIPQTTNIRLYQAHTKLSDFHLQEKDHLYCWFGNDPQNAKHDWLYRLRIEKIQTAHDDNDQMTLIKQVGEIPPAPQVISKTTKPTSTDNLLDFEISLVAALMLIVADGNGQPVRWQELVDDGIADELVKRNLIKPCVNPMHKVRLTPFGESELARFMEMSGMMKDR